MPKGKPPVVAKLRARLERARAQYRESNLDDALARANRLRSDVDVSPESAEPEVVAIIGATCTLIGLCQIARDAGELAQRGFVEAVRSFASAGVALIGRGDYVADYGIAQQECGAADEAEGLLRQALDLGEDTPDVRRHLGACLLDKGDVEGALEVLDDAVVRAPLDWQAHLLRAQACAQSGRLGRRAVANAWFEAGQSMESSGLLDRATSAYRAALDADPDDMDSLTALGGALLTNGHAGEAVEVLDRVTRASPRAESHILAAKALDSVERYDEALEHAELAVGLDPTSADALAAHAAALYQVGDHREALLAADRALALSPPGSGADSAASLVRGFALLSLKRYQEAIEALEHAAEVSNGNPSVLEALGRAYLDNQNLEQALAVFDRAIEANPDLPSPYLNRANLLLELDQPQQARDDLEQLVRIVPSSAYALGQLANVLYLLDERGLALARIEEALSISPEWTWALTRRGDLLASLDRLPEAIECYRHALKVQPDFTDAIIGLADALLTNETDDLQEIMTVLSDALQPDRGSPQLHALMGELLRRQDRPVEALEFLNNALDLDPEYAFALGTRGQVLRSLGRIDPAVADLTRARDLDPNQLWICIDLAQTLQSVGRMVEAIAEWSSAVAIAPTDGELWAQLAQAKIAVGRVGDAVADLRHAVEIEPGAAWIWDSLADGLRRAGELEEAIRATDRALALDPDSFDAHLTRGQALYEADQFEEAAIEFEDAARERPDQPYARSALGEAYRCVGRLEDAIATLSAVLDEQPSDAEALVSRGAAYRARGELDLAIADLTEAWRLDSTSLFTFSNLRLALTAAGRTEDAVALFRRVPEELRPDLEWQREYASLLQAAGHQRKALRVMDNALWANPNDSTTIRALGWMLTSVGRYEDAVATFQRALLLDPDDVEALTNIADPLSRLGRHLEALASVHRALGIRPDSRWALISQCQLLADIGEWELAASVGRIAVRRRTADPSGYLALGWAAEHLDSGAAEALDAATKAVDVDATVRWSRKARANAYWLLDRQDEARADYQWVIDEVRLPAHPDSEEWSLQGWCHFRLSRFAEAANAYSRALRTATDVRAGIFFDLGLALFCDDDDERAVDAYERGLKAAESEGDLQARGTLSIALHDLRIAGRTETGLFDRGMVSQTRQRLSVKLDKIPRFDDLNALIA